MTIALLADDELKKEWLGKTIPGTIELTWADSLRAFTIIEADAYFDLQFNADRERIDRLQPLAGKPLFVNSVTWTTQAIGQPFIRINAWPTFLQRPVTEVSSRDTSYENIVSGVFGQLQWSYQLVPDMPGMITPRVLATIINEAYYTFGAGVSTKEAIDIAMKLGTNYPMGPFEWSARIGLARIYELLNELSKTDPRYTVAPALEKEIGEM